MGRAGLSHLARRRLRVREVEVKVTKDEEGRYNVSLTPHEAWRFYGFIEYASRHGMDWAYTHPEMGWSRELQKDGNEGLRLSRGIVRRLEKLKLPDEAWRGEY
jgi:hypothetical protein